jgi:hypothetical protein
MFTRHGTPDCQLPTPFRDSSGGRITIPMSRPSLHSFVFLVGFTRIADGRLATDHLQHHATIWIATHSACVLLTVVSQNFVVRFAEGDRGARIIIGAIGVLGLWLGDTPASGASALPSMVMVGVAGLLTASGEICFRLSTRRTKRDSSNAAPPQTDLPADNAARAGRNH